MNPGYREWGDKHGMQETVSIRDPSEGQVLKLEIKMFREHKGEARMKEKLELSLY